MEIFRTVTRVGRCEFSFRTARSFLAGDLGPPKKDVGSKDGDGSSSTAEKAQSAGADG